MINIFLLIDSFWTILWQSETERKLAFTKCFIFVFFVLSSIALANKKTHDSIRYMYDYVIIKLITW